MPACRRGPHTTCCDSAYCLHVDVERTVQMPMDGGCRYGKWPRGCHCRPSRGPMRRGMVPLQGREVSREMQGTAGRKGRGLTFTGMIFKYTIGMHAHQTEVCCLTCNVYIHLSIDRAGLQPNHYDRHGESAGQRLTDV
jgi:hypothetical protein